VPEKNVNAGGMTRDIGDDGDQLQTTRPGAVAERGDNLLPAPPLSPSINLALPNTTGEALSGAIEAQVVNQEDMDNQLEERLRQRTVEVADHVMERLRENVIEAEQVRVTVGFEEMMMSKRRQRLCQTGVCLLVVVLAVIVVIVVVVLVTRQPSPGHPTTSPSRPPTTVPSTMHPSSRPTASPRASGLHSNLSENIAQLIGGASNYTLLTQYLSRDSVWNLTRNLTAENVTLFAPSDQSFENFASVAPFSFYFLDSVYDWWSNHFLLTIIPLVVTEVADTTEIFAVETLPTTIETLSLSVNVTTRTIENGARIVDANIQASNGYIQVPDRVLLIPILTNTLYDNVMATNEFIFSDNITTFRRLLVLSGLQGSLMQNLPFGFAIFVPTDTAFASLNQTLLQSLSAPTTFTKDLIAYHMVDRNVHVFDSSTFFMMNDESAWFSTNSLSGQHFVNKAQILEYYFAQNG
jgi:uncharacterized surface protein with fasciclin (FAS1) repeats